MGMLLGRLKTLAGVVAVLALIHGECASAVEAPAGGPDVTLVPAPILPTPPTTPVLPAVNGIDGRVAQAWALRAILEKIDNTGTQYQVAQVFKYAGTDRVRLKRAAADAPQPEGMSLKERVIEQDGSFKATVTPVIQTREMVQNAQRVRYSLGVYFCDLAEVEEKTRIVTVLPVGPEGQAAAPVSDPIEVRIFRRVGEGVLLTQGEAVLVDSKSGITVDAAAVFLERTRGVSVLETAALPDGVALPGERVVEPIEQVPAALGAMGRVLTLKLPVDAKTGAVDATPGANWRVAVDLTSLCGLPLKHAHAVPVKFEPRIDNHKEIPGEMVFQGSCVFALQGDEFRGENELLAAVARLEKATDVRDWKVQGAVGRGQFEVTYSISEKRVIRAKWTETLTQLNLQVGPYERRAYTGTREVEIKIENGK